MKYQPGISRYCSYCGLSMLPSLVGAEKNIVYYGEYSSMPYAAPFDEKTGERQYCPQYVCPKWKRVFFGLFYSVHDNYYINEIVTL